MLQEIGEGRFNNQFVNLNAQPGDIAIVYRGTCKRDDSILASYDGEKVVYPTVDDVMCLGYDAEAFIYLFSIDDRNYFMLRAYSNELPEVEGYEYIPMMKLHRAPDQEAVFILFTSYHLYDWYRSNQHCGRCGSKVQHSDRERMLRCPDCGHMIFPKICPAVIVAVRNGDKLLGSRYAARPNVPGYALIAGFCEIGETAEETVAREVMEEVGLKVKNITYYASQPWGRETDLLLGYYCDVDGDDSVTLDENELCQAVWLSREEIPENPSLYSLTATMQDAFRRGEI